MNQTKRQTYIFGNWKMHMAAAETVQFVQAILPSLEETTCIVGISPPFTSIDAAAKTAQGSSLRVGAQNMSEYPKGAYTGEISSNMLKEAGAEFVLLGHSERRSHFHEDDQMIHRKMRWALQEELMPVLCIGETQEERDKEMTEKVLTRQLAEALRDFTDQELQKILIAYEPVWAIGTGKTATPAIAQETHHLCRSFLSHQWSEEIAKQIPLLYGGSVKPDNTAALMAEPDIDGALVGGASLEVESFIQIINNAQGNLK